MDKSSNGVELLEYQSVPTGDTENKFGSTPKKYTVNKSPTGVRISRPILVLIMAGVVLLLVGAVLATFFLVPRCTEATVKPIVQREELAELKEDWNERLPRTLHPTHYRLKIMPFIIPGNFTTDGEVTIEFNCVEDTDKISFHINDMTIHENFLKVTEVKNKNGKMVDIHIKEFQYETEKQRLTVTVDDLLLSGNQYEIYIKYTGHLNDLLQGFYRINYYDYSARQNRWMAATQFSPTDARRAFPCFDEPAMKAKFTISLARNITMTTRSNMEIKDTVPVEGINDWVWDNYHTTPIMSTYLVAMIVSNLKPFDYNNTENNVKFKVWSRNEALQQTRYAGLIGRNVLSYFETYFQINFPLPKLDIFALPDFGFNAMENWGLITFREASLLYDSKNTPIDNKRLIATVLSHELGHQWFGNLVTPDWWDDLWLKEGFATYTEYLGVHHVQPTWNILDEMVLSEHQASFELDCLMSSHPIYVPVNRSEQIRQIFDPISYAKGASIIRMINNFLGEATFKAGLINYLNENKYANAYHDDLWNSLTKQAHIDGTLDKNMTVKQVMDTWILQSGYPVVDVIRDYENNTATLNQKRFLLSNNANDESLWWIPISYTTSTEDNFSNTTPKTWMKGDKTISLTNLPDNNKWLYVNINEGGFYRVNYDIDNWKMLVKNLHNFSPVIKAQLADDALDLARANLLPYDVPFNLLVEMFKNAEQPYVPLAATFDGLEFLNNMLLSTSSYGNFKQFLAIIMDRLFKNVGLDEKPDDGYDMQMKRASVLKWACRFESSGCIIHFRHLFRTWMSDEEINPIKPNLKYVVYCTAIREGGEAEWNFAFSQFLKTNLATEKTVLLQSMGCASQPWILSKYLNLILKNDSTNASIRKQDGSAVFQSVAKNVAGYQLAFNFLRQNWKELNEYYGLAFSAISKMVGSLSTYFNTPYQLSELAAFKEQNINNLGTSERSFEQTIEKVRANVEWMKHSYKEVENWIDQTITHFRLYK